MTSLRAPKIHKRKLTLDYELATRKHLHAYRSDFVGTFLGNRNKRIMNQAIKSFTAQEKDSTATVLSQINYKILIFEKPNHDLAKKT